VIILIAIAVHFLLLFGVQPTYLNIFRKSVDDNPASSSRRASFPDAIIAVTIDIEGDEPTPVEIEPPPLEDQVTEVVEDDSQFEDDVESDDLTDILGESQAPLPSKPSTRAAVIPPRPVEITWPETKKLGHCLGMHVDLRIRVSKTGEVLHVVAHDSTVPEDCVSAAVSAARRIVFLPGRKDGQPETMWTEIRIDFRRQSR
jgi:hypothetical protein